MLNGNRREHFFSVRHHSQVAIHAVLFERFSNQIDICGVVFRQQDLRHAIPHVPVTTLKKSASSDYAPGCKTCTRDSAEIERGYCSSIVRFRLASKLL